MRRYLIGCLAVFLAFYWSYTSWSRAGFIGFLEGHPSASWAPRAAYALGLVYYMRSDYPSSIECLDWVRTKHPKSPYAMRAHFRLARAYSYAGDLGRTLEEYRSFLERYPESEYALIVDKDYRRLKFR